MLSCCFWLPGAAHTHAHTDRRFCTAGSCQCAETRCERNVFVLLSRTKFERACGWVLPVFRAGEGGGGAPEWGGGAASDWLRGNKSKLSPQHAKNLPVVAFSVLWCLDLSQPVPLPLGIFWFISCKRRIEVGFCTQFLKVWQHCVIIGCKPFKQAG